MSGWDGFFNDMDMAVQRHNHQKAFDEYERRITSLREVAVDGQDIAAKIYGIREALIVQLERYDPNNPVIKDDALVERIKNAAVSAFRVGSPDFERAKEAGRTFRVPGHEGPVKQPVPAVAVATVTASPFARAAAVVAPAAPAAALPPTLSTVRNHPAHVELQQKYAGSLALRAALSEVVKQLDPNHPLLNDHFLQSTIRKAGMTAFTIGNLDFDAARSAGVSFVLPKRPAGNTDKPGT